MKLASIKLPVTLHATDEEIAVLVMTARRGGTEAAFYADLLDNMMAVIWASNRREAYDRAEDVVTAAMQLRDYADAALSDERSPWGDQK